jgi:hypothetical protein
MGECKHPTTAPTATPVSLKEEGTEEHLLRSPQF